MPSQANVLAPIHPRTSKEQVSIQTKVFAQANFPTSIQTIRIAGVGGAIYGEITQQQFQKVVDFLKDHCEFDHQSLFLDIGSGLGKPNFHVSIDPGCQVSYGVEIEKVRC